MTSSEEFNIVIVSDLHLGEGRDSRTDMFNLKEHFLYAYMQA
jgi:hypothetical protein